MSYNTFTLTGTYKKPNGVADKGGVTVIPSVLPLVDSVGNVILAGAVQADLDSNGTFSLVLPATGANLLPASFGYTLVVVTNGAGRFADVTFTPGASGTTLNTAQIVPVPLPAVVTPSAVTQAGLDGAVTALVNDAVSGSRAALSATYVALGGTPVGSPPVVKPNTDTRAGVWEFTHNSGTGYLYHLLAGTSFASPAALIAMGIDNGTGTGLLIANKAQGKGIIIDQQSGVNSATAYGLHATQASASAPLVRLEMNSNTAADVLQMLAFGTPGASQRLMYVSDPAGEAGSIFASDGRLRWLRSMRVLNQASGEVASYLEVSTSTSANSSNTRKSYVGANQHTFFGATGSAGQYYCYRINHTGSTWAIETAPNLVSADALNPLPTEPGTWTQVIGVKAGKLGLYTTPPITQPTRAGQLTDNSGGTSGGNTIAAVTDVATTANAVATLAARLNLIEAKLSQAGGGLGVTA